MSTASNTAAAGAGKSLADLRGAGKMVAKQAGGGTVAAFFEANKDAIKAVLPAHMTPDRMLKIALRALRTTPKLMNCTIESLFGAIVTCAQLGLEPNTPQGHIYLIPFENKRKKITEVQVVIGYKGLLDLARRSGEIETIAARVAYKGDDFSIEYGTEDSIHHKPCMIGEPGEVLGVYAVAKLKGGGYQFEWMSVAQINGIRDNSQGYKTAVSYNRNDNPWISHWEEMARKTVIRRLCKYLPMSIELAMATALDSRAESGKAQGLENILDGDFTVLPEDAPEDEAEESPADDGGSASSNQPAQVEHTPAVPMPDAQPQRQAAEVLNKEPAPKEEPKRRAAPAEETAPATAAPVEPAQKPAAPAAAQADDGFGEAE